MESSWSNFSNTKRINNEINNHKLTLKLESLIISVDYYNNREKLDKVERIGKGEMLTNNDEIVLFSKVFKLNKNVIL